MIMGNISRRKAREEAIIILYQIDLLKKNADDSINNERNYGKEIDDFTDILIKGVYNNLNVIDMRIKNVVENWSLERIAIIDRNILRVAIYEMLYRDEIPLKVSVDEAIEIAKEFGQKDDTPKFINGVLGKILTEIQEERD